MKKIFISMFAVTLSISAFSQNWLLTGNSGTNPATNFVGTTDANRLVFRTNNAERMTILSGGNVGIGTSAPAVPLHVVSNSADQFLRLSGNAPSLQLIDSPSTSTNRLGKLALASGSGQFVATAHNGDLILQNLDSVGGLLFGTNIASGNGVERARFTPVGYFGIATTAPTAKLDVNCAAVAGQSNPSNIRFESLQSGSGTVLVIDSNGYVYKSASGVKASVPNTPLSSDLQNELENLRTQVEEMRSLLANRLNLSPAEANSLKAQSSTWLGNNYPNPATGATTIEYSLPSQVSNATCQVYSLDGKPIQTLVLNPTAGKSQVQLGTGKLAPGMYIYTLIVNGKAVDSKRLVVAQQ